MGGFLKREFTGWLAALSLLHAPVHLLIMVVATVGKRVHSWLIRVALCLDTHGGHAAELDLLFPHACGLRKHSDKRAVRHNQVQHALLRVPILLHKVKLRPCGSLNHLRVAFWVPVLHLVQVLLIVDVVEAVEILIPESRAILIVLDLLQGEHRDRIIADLHLRLQVLAKLIVKAERSLEQRLADHRTRLHRA